MPKTESSSRRRFLKKFGGSTLAFAAAPLASLAGEAKREERLLLHERKIMATDKIRVGVIGLGIMGYNDLTTALKVPGVEMAGACDLYTGRLERARELYGKDLFVTQDYRELLNRKDIDAVIIASSDNWHARQSIDAMQSGKAVYCEKPMVHRISEGAGVIAAAQKSGNVFQVGSQGVSSIVTEKAREIVASKTIGDLVLGREQAGGLAAGALQAGDLQTDPDRPVEDLELGAALLLDLGPDHRGFLRSAHVVHADRGLEAVQRRGVQQVHAASSDGEWDGR